MLFVDIRAFTALSEHKFAYDVVHILNRFFAAANLAIQESGGGVDKFIGDGLMALFVDPRGIDFACRAAIAAASAIGRELATVNRDLSAELRSLCASPWACMRGASCSAGSVPGARRRGP